MEAKHKTLIDELSLKDKRLLNMRSNLLIADEVTHISEIWRNAAHDLAAMVVHACVSVQDMPSPPVPPRDLFVSLFQGFARVDELNKHKLQYDQELKAYNRMRRSNVVVRKEMLEKALKNSKVGRCVYVCVYVRVYVYGCMYVCVRVEGWYGIGWFIQLIQPIRLLAFAMIVR